MLDYDVDTPANNLMVVNQVYDPNWRVVEGSGKVVSAGGLVGVRIPPGRQHLKLAYRSLAFVAGLIITFLTSIVAVVICRREA